MSILYRGTVEFEVARMAAAFGVEKWDNISSQHKGERDCEIYLNDFSFSCLVTLSGLECIDVWTTEDNDWVFRLMKGAVEWRIYYSKVKPEFIPKALYRLGFEGASILSQLPQLSATEKAELAIDFPRKFWPQKWLDEVATA